MRIKSFLMIILIFSTNFAFSETLKTSSSTPLSQPKSISKSIDTDHCYYPAYSSPARIDVQAAWNFIVSASFIYWQPEMIGVDLGYIPSNDLSSYDSSIVNFDTDYYPGFKVLLGTHYDYDNWNINARYTRFHAKETEKNSKGDIIYHVFSESISISPLEARWRPKIDYFDLEVGRPFYSGKHLVMKPYASIKGGWTKQTFKFNAEVSGVKQEADLKNKSWFLGPRAVLDMNWLLSYDLKIFLNSSFSLMYQQFKTKDFFKSEFHPMTYSKRFRAKSIQITPTFDLSPGFGWSSYFDHNNWHVDLFAAYNFVYFFNQNEFSAINASGDLMFHGLEVSLRFDF
ncbi:MAG: hypothetical protein K1060chlam1_00722 [Candidatus Anoxychlamydiales bacterium]|nr:hypothetical protein [Candidatus Anoxychlamydiales bacterium]